jgi:hypothetical protein
VPLLVVDGDFAGGVPAELKNACQDAANRWVGYLLVPVFLLFIPAILLGVVLTRRGQKL